MTKEHQPPPPPDTRYALPRTTTALGQRADDLMAALLRKAPPHDTLTAADDLLRQFEAIAAEYDGPFFDPDEDGTPPISEDTVNHYCAVLRRVRDLVEAGDQSGATALLETESYTRDSGHVQLAYRAAMEATRAV